MISIFFLQELETKTRDALAKANEVADECISTMRTVRSFANEANEVSYYAEKMAEAYKLKVKEAYAYAGFMWCSDVSIMGTLLCQILVVLQGSIEMK